MLETPHEGQFLYHFVNSTAELLACPSKRDEDGPGSIVSTIISIGATDPVVLKALLCLGASHMIQFLSASPSSLDEESFVQLREEKTRLLREAEQLQYSRLHTLTGVDNKKAEYDALIASYLLLFIYEFSEGTGNSSWLLRLDGARSVVSTAWEEHRSQFEDEDEESSSEDEGECLDREQLESLDIDNRIMQFFIYHDVLTRVTAQKPQSSLLNHVPPKAAFPSPKTNRPEDMFGVYNGLIDIILRIAVLRTEANAVSIPSGTIISEAVEIWQDIDNWDLHYAPGNEPSSDYRHMCEAYISASFIWLFSIIYPDRIADEKVQATAQKGLEALSLIEAPGILTFGLFPIFVIGTACIYEQTRDMVDKQLDRGERLCRFRNVMLCRDVIRSAWRVSDSEGDGHGWDWIRLMEEQSVSLPIT